MNNLPISLKELTKSFGDFNAVDSISLDIQEGEIYGFLGPNGAGKSTTIRAILNFIRPTKGKIEVFSLDSVNNSTEIKKHIGYLAGSAEVYEEMRVERALRYFANLKGVNCDKEIKSLSRKFKLDLTKKVGDLSKGNLQKVALIQAFMHNPQLLILDEPTSGLDPLMKEVFYKLIKSKASKGATIFLSSHDLLEVQKVCHKLAIIKDGKIIAVEDLTQNSRLNTTNYEITLSKPIKKVELEKVKSIVRSRVSGKKVTIATKGDLTALFRKLSKYGIVKISEKKITLEDLFLHYY